MDLGGWLRSLGLEQYEATLRDNAIDQTVLGDLTEEHLRELGFPLGARLKLLKAIAALDPRPEAAGWEPVAAAAPAAPALAAAPAAAAHVDAAERRQVTVLFADLVGSTALSARMDPEDLREIISAYQTCVADTVRRYGGFVAKYMGDGVLAYFGYPQAHEDDAERAVRAGLELIAAVAGLKTRASLQSRIGIATGLVVVGDLIGTGSAREQAIVGETPNLAARLQGIAEPNTVVLAAGTRRLLGNLFELADLGAKDLKGIAGPERVFAALRASAVESRFEAMHASGLTALVGREEELELLLRRWRQAKAGDGNFALISGEPGIGKSRIAQAMAERIGGEPHTRLRYFCSPHHQDSALYPAITQLERAAGLRREDTADERLAKLEAVLAEGTNDLGGVVPLIADLLSIPLGERYPPLNLTPQKRKERTLAALVALVEGLAAHQPVVMLFEDLHWSDPTTREWLDLLIERLPALRVLVIITFRPEFAPPWVGRAHVTLLSLNRLGPRQRAEMIARVTGGKALPREIAEQIIDRTDGVPLFIEELTKTVVESGSVTDAGDRYALAGPSAPLAVPTTLQGSLLARLDRLAPTREVAQIAAALGRSFSHELISAVAPMPQEQLDDALAQLARAELIFRRGTPPDAAYTFKHALVQDAAYDTLLRSRRQELHGRIVATLEVQFPETAQTRPELLAHHCAEANLHDKAIGYWLSAGQQALARSAMAETVALLRKGLGLVSQLPDGAARQERELDLQIALGHALMAARGYAAPEILETFQRARHLCEQLARPALLGTALHGQYVFHSVRAEFEQAEIHAQEMLRLGEVRDDAAWKFYGWRYSGDTRTHMGNFVEARAYYETALSLWNPMFRAVAATPQDPYVGNLVHLSRTLLCLGYVDQARLRLAEALAEARRLSPHTIAYSLVLAWLNRAVAGHKPSLEVLSSAEQVAAISDEHGFTQLASHGHIIRGWYLSWAGQAEDGVLLIRQGLANRRAADMTLYVPFMLTRLAEAYGLGAQPQAALERLAEAADLVEATQERWAEADLHRLRGTLLLSVGDHAAAEASYHRALAVARRQSARFWELKATLDLACLWRDQGKRAAARDLLAPVYNWFTEGFDTPVLKESKSLLDELSGSNTVSRSRAE